MFNEMIDETVAMQEAAHADAMWGDELPEDAFGEFEDGDLPWNPEWDED